MIENLNPVWVTKARSDAGAGSWHIFTRLSDRYRLDSGGTPSLWFPGQMMAMARVIQPVTSMDDLLRTSVIASESKSLVSSNGVYHTVPAGKRRHVTMLRKEATTGSTYPILDDGTTSFILAVAGTAVFLNFQMDFWMEPGWRIIVAQTSNGADTAIPVTIVYQEEDAY